MIKNGGQKSRRTVPLNKTEPSQKIVFQKIKQNNEFIEMHYRCGTGTQLPKPNLKIRKGTSIDFPPHIVGLFLDWIR